MPKVKRPVIETNTSVVRPVARKVLADVMANSNIRDLFGKLRVYYPGESNPVEQPGGNIDNRYEQNRFASSDALEIVVSERYIEDLLSASKTQENNQIPLWINEALEVTMRPIYAPVEMVITIRYRAASRADARSFYDYMMMKLPDREDQYFHDVSYSIVPPEVYMVILKEIYRLQELTEPYGETWEEFFAKSARPGYRELTDNSGKNSIGVWGETQDHCLGFFDIPYQAEQAIKEDGPDSYYVEFPYILRYERIKDVEFVYPVSIHNTVLSSKYRNDRRMMLADDKQRMRTTQLDTFAYFRGWAGLKRPYNDLPGRYFPEYDEFVPRSVYPLTLRVFTALVLLDDTNMLMNLRDLETPDDGMVITDRIKAAMVKEAPWINRYRSSIFNISLYQGRNLMDPKFIAIDEDLNILCPQPLSKRNFYHVRFSIVTDISILDEEAKDRLKDDPDLLEDIIDYIIPDGRPRPVVPRPLTDMDFDEIVKEIRDENGKDNFGTPGMRRQMRTVQTARLYANKESYLKRKSQ